MRRALLLAAGRATRLGEMSRITPKCLQVLQGQTLLDRLVGQLLDAGVEEVLINTHHLATQVADHVAEASWRDIATVTYEPTLLGTLGTLRENAAFLSDEGGWVLHADNYIKGTLVPLLRSFETRPLGVWGSLLVFPVGEPSNYGVVVTDERGIVESFHEKQQTPPSTLASAATLIMDPSAISFACGLPPTARDLSRDLLPALHGRLVACMHFGEIIDIGTPEGLSRAQSVAASAGCC